MAAIIEPISETTLEEIRCALAAISDKKGERVAVLDVRGKSSITDVLILVSGTSDPHVKAIKGALDQALKSAGVQLIGQDRETGSGWMVVDAFDFMIHLQTTEKRDFYALDRLWKDAPSLNGQFSDLIDG